jgi:hypothetical protein
MPLLVEAGPIFVGATHRPFSFTWQDDSGAPIDLTAATFSARFRNHSSGVAITGTGTFANVDLPNGKFTYKLASADIATAANYEVQITATWAGPEKELSDLFILPVESPI